MRRATIKLVTAKIMIRVLNQIGDETVHKMTIAKIEELKGTINLRILSLFLLFMIIYIYKILNI